MQTVVSTGISSAVAEVPFSAIAEGDWFINYAGDLGVKLNARGFYPLKRAVGSGWPESPVTPVKAVSINATTV